MDEGCGDAERVERRRGGRREARALSTSEAHNDIDGCAPPPTDSCRGDARGWENAREGSVSRLGGGLPRDDQAEKGDRGSGRWLTGHWCSRDAEERHFTEVQSKCSCVYGSPQ